MSAETLDRSIEIARGIRTEGRVKDCETRLSAIERKLLDLTGAPTAAEVSLEQELLRLIAKWQSDMTAFDGQPVADMPRNFASGVLSGARNATEDCVSDLLTVLHRAGVTNDR